MTQSNPLVTRRVGTIFWLWLLSSSSAGVLIGAGFYFLGEIDGIPVAAVSLILLGVPQGLILHKYARRVHWAKWAMWGSLGLLAAIPLALMIDFIAEAGGGLNPETDVRGCLVQGVTLSGFIFGFVQNASSRNAVIWGFVYAAAVVAAALVGGAVGFWAYNAVKLPYELGVSDSPARGTGVAWGFLVGMVVYGVITGLAMTYSSRSTYISQTDREAAS